MALLAVADGKMFSLLKAVALALELLEVAAIVLGLTLLEAVLPLEAEGTTPTPLYQ